jgi:hypothetical protein
MAASRPRPDRILSRLANLSPVARDLLALLATCRCLSAEQAARALGSGPSRRAARELRAAGLALSFTHYDASPRLGQTGAGRKPAAMRILALAPLGRRAARQLTGAGPLGGRADQLGALFLAHHLAVQDLYLDLRALVAEGQLAEIDWRSGPQATVAFRSLAAPGGRGRLTPDARVTLWSAAGRSVEVCFELDRGTMGRSAIGLKLARYREWYADRSVPFAPDAAADRDARLVFAAEDLDRRRWLADRLAEGGVRGLVVAPEAAARAAAAELAP